MTEHPIAGVWAIERAEFYHLDGNVTPRGHEPTALLMFTETGLMSLVLNEGRPDDEAFRCLCYAGTYHLEGDQVIHAISLSHDPEEVGKTLLRTYRRLGPLLEMRVAPTDEGQAVCLWRRMA